VRIGKLLNAHHIVTGGFITDTRGRLVLTARAIETETGRIEYSTRVNGKTDDVLEVVEQLAKQVNSGLKLPALQPRVREASNTPSGGASGSAPGSSSSAAPARRQAVPFQAVMLYSRALQALDKQEKGEAVQLFRASLDKFPDYEAAKQQLAKLQPGA
jgi:TolA-binding protein